MIESGSDRPAVLRSYEYYADPGTGCRVSAHVKNPASKVQFIVSAWQKNLPTPRSVKTYVDDTPNGWKEIRDSITIPDGEDRLMVIFRLAADGTVRIDDVKIERMK